MSQLGRVTASVGRVSVAVCALPLLLAAQQTPSPAPSPTPSPTSGAAGNGAQRQVRTIQVTVTSVSGHSVYVDKGRADGLVPGTVLRLFPPGLAQLEVEVTVASNNSARGDVAPALPVPPVGTRGEAEVEISPPSASTPTRPTRPTLDHPPWSRQDDGRESGQPLLVPAYGQRPEKRPMELHGRLFGQGQWNIDRTGDADADYWLLRAGAAAELSNPFGQGGRLQFDGEFDVRGVHLADAPDESDQTGRLDLLSYAIGLEDYSPFRAEVGRFFSAALPEIGLVDGVEVLGQLQGGYRIGVGLGSYPAPFPARDTGEDVGAHVVFDYAMPKTRSLAWTIGLQKTWHEGTPDRDLLLLRTDGRLANGWSWAGSAKVDFYTGRDTLKGSGAEVTEFMGSLRNDGTVAGAGVVASHFAWPELLRREFQDLPPELVQDGHVERLSATGWLRATDLVRVSGRFDLWWDQDSSGTAGELAADWNDAFRSGASLLAAISYDDGSFASGPGARLRLRKNVGDFYGDIGWSWHRYDLADTTPGPLVRQTIDLSIAWQLGDLDLDLTLQRWFGDSEDATTFGLYAQYRF